MRKLALPVMIIAALGATSAMAATAPAKPAPAKPAVAAPTVTDGVIKAINAKAETVTLDNKTTYYFPAKFDLSKVKVGEKVAITWTAKGKKDMASKIDAAA
jgi:curli biogenesis system outer membrane secretion channel CsgG